MVAAWGPALSVESKGPMGGTLEGPNDWGTSRLAGGGGVSEACGH